MYENCLHPHPVLRTLPLHVQSTMIISMTSHAPVLMFARAGCQEKQTTIRSLMTQVDQRID